MGGSGASFIKDAILAEAELFITGDVRYHDAQYAIQEGINVLDMGHFYSELGALVLLQELIMTRFGNIKINLYSKESNPFISWR
jgi:putative NIF3 family GTP cyclohydrolase 1 type 2